VGKQQNTEAALVCAVSSDKRFEWVGRHLLTDRDTLRGRDRADPRKTHGVPDARRHRIERAGRAVFHREREVARDIHVDATGRVTEVAVRGRIEDFNAPDTHREIRHRKVLRVKE